MFPRLFALLRPFVTAMLWPFTPLLAGLFMIFAVIVSGAVYTANALRNQAVIFGPKILSYIDRRLCSVLSVGIAKFAFLEAWVSTPVTHLKSIHAVLLPYYNTCSILGIFMAGLAVPLCAAANTSAFEHLACPFFHAYLLGSLLGSAVTIKVLHKGAAGYPPSLGAPSASLAVWNIVALDLQWLKRCPRTSICAHAILLLASLILYNYAPRATTSTPAPKPQSSLDQPGKRRKSGSPITSKPVWSTKSQKRMPGLGQATSRGDDPTPANQFVPLHGPMYHSTLFEMTAAGPDMSRITSAVKKPRESPAQVWTPHRGTLDAADHIPQPAYEPVKKRTRRPIFYGRSKPSAPPTNPSHPIRPTPQHEARVTTAAEEKYRNSYKGWWLPEAVVPDRKRTPYSFCSQPKSTKRKEASLTEIQSSKAQELVKVVGVPERSRTPYRLVAHKEWTCVLRPKQRRALPAPNQDLVEARPEPPKSTQIYSNLPESDSSSDLDDDSDDDLDNPLTPRDPVPTVPEELRGRPEPAAPVTGKRGSEEDLPGTPPKRQRTGEIELQDEAHEAPLLAACPADHPAPVPNAPSTPDSSPSTPTSPSSTSLKRVSDDPLPDTPSKRHCGMEKKKDHDAEPGWIDQNTLQDNHVDLRNDNSLPEDSWTIDGSDQQAALSETLSTQQPEPDHHLAASAVAVASVDATAPTVFAPVSGSLTALESPQQSHLPSSIGQLDPDPPLDTQPAGHPPVPDESSLNFDAMAETPDDGQNLLVEFGNFINSLLPPTQLLPGEVDTLDGLDDLFSGMELGSAGVPVFDAAIEMFIDQTMNEMTAQPMTGGEMAIDEAAGWMSTWPTPEELAMVDFLMLPNESMEFDINAWPELNWGAESHESTSFPAPSQPSQLASSVSVDTDMGLVSSNALGTGGVTPMDAGVENAAYEEMESHTPIGVPMTISQTNENWVDELVASFDAVLSNWAWEQLDIDGDDVLDASPGSPSLDVPSLGEAPLVSFQAQGLMMAVPVTQLVEDNLVTYEEAVDDEDGAAAVVDAFLAELQTEWTRAGLMDFAN
ncbi:hypothetical protein FRC12_011527 [Ceratobasidium sp. 428]|nr:hypothetical protein FRC12_011527 [Ceratobasidium sp. 428]